MSKVPDQAAKWVKQACPDDDYLAPADPPELAGRGSPGVSVAEERAFRPKIGFDGRIATVLGRLTPDEFKAALRVKIDKTGNLATPAAPSFQRTVRSRGRPSKVTATFTLEEYLATEERRRRAEEDASRSAAERRRQTGGGAPRRAKPPSGLRFSRNPAWIVPEGLGGQFVPMKSGPLPRSQPDLYRLRSTIWNDDEAAWVPDNDAGHGVDIDLDIIGLVPDDEDWEWDGIDVDDRLPYQVEADEDAEFELANMGRDEEAIAVEWRREIETRALVDERFAPDPSCGNPNGCTNKPKPRGDRCGACYEYRRTHRGEERPMRLVNRARRRKAL